MNVSVWEKYNAYMDMEWMCMRGGVCILQTAYGEKSTNTPNTYIHRNKGLVAMLQAHISLFWCIDVCILFLGVYWFVLSLCACVFACLPCMSVFVCVSVKRAWIFIRFAVFFSVSLSKCFNSGNPHTHTHEIKLYTQSEYTLVSYDWTMCRFENEMLTTNDRKKKKRNVSPSTCRKLKNLYSRIAAHIHTIPTIWLNYWGELVSKYPTYTSQFSNSRFIWWFWFKFKLSSISSWF